MKIAVLHNSSPGGAARLVVEVSTRLGASDDVTVFAWGDEVPPAQPGTNALWCRPPQVHLPPPLHPFGDLVRSYFGSRRAAARVDGLGFDVALVLACRWGQAPSGLRHLQTPSVYWAQETRRRSYEPNYRPSGVQHGWRRGAWWVGGRAYDAIASALDRRAIASAGGVATNTEFSASRLADAYGIAAKVIELGVDADRFHPPASEQPRAGALLVGALDPTKGAELAVRGLALVPLEHRPALRLVFNREGVGFRAHLVELADRLDVDLRLVGTVTEADLLAEYQCTLLLLALAGQEPFGLTVLEASACGTPTVAVSDGGFRRTVEPGLNGVLVPSNPEDVASAVVAIVSGTQTFDREAMVRWTKLNWGWDRCVAELREYLQAVARHPGNPGRQATARRNSRGRP